MLVECRHVLAEVGQDSWPGSHVAPRGGGANLDPRVLFPGRSAEETKPTSATTFGGQGRLQRNHTARTALASLQPLHCNVARTRWSRED